MISEAAKSSKGSCKLSIGYLTPEGTLLTVVQMHEMSGVEEDILASGELTAAQKFDVMLTNCIDDFDGIKDKEKIGKMLGELLVADRASLILALRRTSSGDLYRFPVICPHCKETQHKQVNLAELKVTLPRDLKRRVYEVKTPRGHLVEMKLMTGADELRRDKLEKEMENQIPTLLLLLRVQKIDGQPATVEMVRAMATSERQFLRDTHLKEEQFGLETDVDAECRKCSREFKIEMSLGEPSFFFPSAT